MSSLWHVVELKGSLIMTLSKGVGRGHGAHHHGPRAKKPKAPKVTPTAMGVVPATPPTAIPPSAQPVKSKRVVNHKSHVKKVK